MDEIIITAGVTLGSLGVVMLDDRLFEIASNDPDHPLIEHKAKGVAETLRRPDMFDQIRTEPPPGEKFSWFFRPSHGAYFSTPQNPKISQLAIQKTKC